MLILLKTTLPIDAYLAILIKSFKKLLYNNIPQRLDYQQKWIEPVSM